MLKHLFIFLKNRIKWFQSIVVFSKFDLEIYLKVNECKGRNLHHLILNVRNYIYDMYRIVFDLLAVKIAIYKILP